MAQQKAPNPIELYEAAVHSMVPIMAGIRRNQLTATTPCDQWNVQALLVHNIKVADFAFQVVQGNVTVNDQEVSGPLPREGAAAAFEAGTKRVVDLLKSTRDLSRVVQTPFGPLPIAHFMMFPTLDIAIHKWDLAKGTNQNTSIDASLAQACYTALMGAIEGARQAGAFGPEVKVPMNASIQNKLLGLSGRQP